jgi:hypothetical protein
MSANLRWRGSVNLDAEVSIINWYIQRQLPVGVPDNLDILVEACPALNGVGCYEDVLTIDRTTSSSGLRLISDSATIDRET